MNSRYFFPKYVTFSSASEIKGREFLEEKKNWVKYHYY